MNWLNRIVSRFRSTNPPARRPGRRPSWRPEVALLEDRTVPATFSSIASNFNGTSIAAGDSLWFNSAFKASNVPATPTTLHVTDQTITFASNGTAYTVAVPDSVITLSSATTVATTSFDTANNTWVTNLPRSFSGNGFLGGASLALPDGLSGGIKTVTWSGNFSTDNPGITLNWQWGAAVYTSFSGDYNALNVKPLDGSGSVTVYHNSHHAGTPEAFTSFVTGGARGGGGSNFTGSYSSTKAVIPSDFVPPPPPPPTTASVSGYVYQDADASGDRGDPDFALSGVTLSLYDANGNFVGATTTDGSGFYSFIGLAAGDYTIVETQPEGYLQATNNVGSLGGSSAGDTFQLTLHSGDVGLNYNFGETVSQPDS